MSKSNSKCKCVKSNSKMESISMSMSNMLSKKLVEMVEEVTKSAIEICASKYNFSKEDALRLVGVSEMVEKVGGRGRGRGSGRVVGVSRSGSSGRSTPIMKRSIPLPYNGNKKEECCNALRSNNGLYTQCDNAHEMDKLYCIPCETQMTKNGLEIPEYGTITQRQAVDVFSYVDPKGNKPVAYSKVMKKLKLTKEMVVEEASKMCETIDERHFEIVDNRRRKKEKEVKEPKSKGRPKKTKKVIEIDGEDDTEDLFASLVASANAEEVVVEDKEEKDKEKLEKEAKLAEKEAKLAEKAEKEKEKAEKEKEKLAEKEAKLAEKEKEKAEKEKEKAEKAAKLEEEKATKLAEKEAKLVEKEKEKEKAKAVVKKEVKKSEEDEADVVKKIEINGKKYLKSKKTGIIYDYETYIKNGDQVVIGKWNETKNQIDFKAVEEESEEEYESDDDE